MKDILRGKIYTEDFCFKCGEIVCEDGIIAEINILEESQLLDEEKNKLIIPGLVDIHMHGAVGVDVSTADKKDLKKLADYERSCGITSFLPTTMTLPLDKLKTACLTFAKYIGDKSLHGIVGINLEGPFISKDKCGAQNPETVMEADDMDEVLALLQDISGNNIMLTTVAPEKASFNPAIAEYRKKDNRIHFSLGHSNATYEQACDAFVNGADHVTHMYNAMNYVNHREPGIVGAAFDKKDVFVEIICDGNHLHPSLIRSTFEAFGAERMVLISDSTEATGCEDGVYTLGDRPIIKNGNRAVLRDDSSVLAGSVSNLMDCVRYAVNVVGLPLESVIRMATYNPARSVGLDDRVGILKAGYNADFVILDLES